MRQAFFYLMGGITALAVLGLSVWLVLRAFYDMYADRRLGKEMDVLRAETDAKREQQQLDNAQRLDNGCDHLFDAGYGEFPPQVCVRCGLQRDRPAGNCDHVWRRGTGNIPFSFCEKCGKEFRRSGM